MRAALLVVAKRTTLTCLPLVVAVASHPDDHWSTPTWVLVAVGLVAIGCYFSYRDGKGS